MTGPALAASSRGSRRSRRTSSSTSPRGTAARRAAPSTRRSSRSWASRPPAATRTRCASRSTRRSPRSSSPAGASPARAGASSRARRCAAAGSTSCPSRCIVKPNFEGSSKGIGQDSVVEDPIALGRVLDELLAKYPDGALVERYVPGIDVRVVRVEGLPRAAARSRRSSTPAYARRVRRLRLPARQRRHALRRAPRAGAPRRRPCASACATSTERTLSAFALRDVAVAQLPRRRRRRGLVPEHDGHPELRARRRALRRDQAPIGLDYDATVLAVLRVGGRARTGCWRMLDATKPRPPRARRTSLRVGLAFNMKRIDSRAGRRPRGRVRRARDHPGHHARPSRATATSWSRSRRRRSSRARS